MDDLLILPRGFHGPLGCYHCGGEIDKPQQDKTRANKKNWKIFCSLQCFRTSQTKYHGMSPRDRQMMYNKASKEKIKIKRRQMVGA